MDGLEQAIQAINTPINSIVWGWPTVLLIAITGIALMVGLRFMPLQRLGYGIAMMLRPSDAETEGEISPFQALMTSLSATIGTGNIAGVPSFQTGKIERAKAFLAEHTGPAIDGVTFYSDSHNDIPLLEWADRPVAVDPDERLAARARAEGWSIVSFRAAEPPALV